MILLQRYKDEDKDVWNKFNDESKNSLFIFDRKYMDYHKNRFVDHSLLFYDEDKLIAILPMSEHGDFLVSNTGMKQHIMNDCFDKLISYAKENRYRSIRYKTIPHIYHSQPSEEDRFSLFVNGAKLAAIDVSTYVDLKNPLKMSKGRKAQISRAKREGVVIQELADLEDFMKFIELENKVLIERHNVYAVHTGDELKMLHDRLPENIHLFAALKDKKIIAGTVIYEYEDVVHTQYMAADDEARIIGALDLTISTVIEKYKKNKQWLDFGISTEHGKIYLNEGLVSQKESFGGRTGVYEIWELALC